MVLDEHNPRRRAQHHGLPPGDPGGRAETDWTFEPPTAQRGPNIPITDYVDNHAVPRLRVGIRVDFIEVGPAERPKLLPVAEATERNARSALARRLAVVCSGLAVAALGLPLLLQTYALRTTEASITGLQPAIKEVETLRRAVAARNGAQDIMTQEAARTGDVLQVLATVTRILPDDSYLTDFALRERQLTISGRTGSAPRLITGLSADPAMRDPAFAAPVTRAEGTASEVFSIKAEVVR